VALTTITELILLVYLVRRKLFRSHPVFSAYILGAILQSVLMAATYGIWGYQSYRAWLIFWLSQLVMETARFAAVVEVARRVLFPFSGIWALGRRVLLVPPEVSWFTQHCCRREYWYKLPLNVDRGSRTCCRGRDCNAVALCPLLRPAYGPPGSLVVHRILLVFMFLRHQRLLYDKWLLGYLNLWSFWGS